MVGLNIRLQSSLMMLKMMMVMLIMMMMKIVWQRRRLRSSSPPNKLDPTAKLKQLVKTLTSSSKLNNWHKFVKKNHNLFQGCHLTTIFLAKWFFSVCTALFIVWYRYVMWVLISVWIQHCKCSAQFLIISDMCGLRPFDAYIRSHHSITIF